ncbi:MAG: helix-turn-helix domain-containing protein [Pseudorhodoplanes sp.]
MQNNSWLCSAGPDCPDRVASGQADDISAARYALVRRPLPVQAGYFSPSIKNEQYDSNLARFERAGRLSSESTSLQVAEFTNRDLPGVAQFNAFRSAYRGVFEIFPTKSDGRTFPVCQKIWNLDKLVLVYAQLPGPGYGFGWRHAGRAAFDHWYVLLPFDGAASEAFQGRGGPLSFHCLAKPFQAQLEARGMLMLFIPRSLVAVNLDSVLDRKLGVGAGLLLADFLTLLYRRLPGLRPGELPGVLEAVRGLIAACAALFDRPPSGTGNPIDLMLLNRARRLVERRIAEPGLSPKSLCQELHVSRSCLYRAFEPLGGVSAHIRRQRLLRARDTLLGACDARSIATIAEQWGFADASSFSRAFKHEFGVSPERVRKAGWANTSPHHGNDEPPNRGDAWSLHALLRRMRP